MRHLIFILSQLRLFFFNLKNNKINKNCGKSNELKTEDLILVYHRGNHSIYKNNKNDYFIYHNRRKKFRMWGGKVKKFISEDSAYNHIVKSIVGPY